jgi:hypothetical protein
VPRLCEAEGGCSHSSPGSAGEVPRLCEAEGAFLPPAPYPSSNQDSSEHPPPGADITIVKAAWLKLAALLCITAQVLLGGGSLALTPDPHSDECCTDCGLCEPVPAEDRCCGPAAPPARPCACPLANPRTPAVPADRPGQLKQVATPDPAPLVAWWPAPDRPARLSFEPQVQAGPIRDSCGITTTRLLI